MSSDDIDTFQLRAAFVQAQAQIMNNGAYEPVVVISKPLALSLLDEIDRLRAMTAEQAHVHDAWLAERSLADQLAVALAAQGSASFDEDTNLNIKRLALEAFKEAHRG